MKICSSGVRKRVETEKLNARNLDVPLKEQFQQYFKIVEFDKTHYKDGAANTCEMVADSRGERQNSVEWG